MSLIIKMLVVTFIAVASIATTAHNAHACKLKGDAKSVKAAAAKQATADSRLPASTKKSVKN